MGECGIITFHRTSNFGSCLQAYALYRKVVDLGYDCELIDYRCPAVEERENVGKKYPLTPKGIALRFLYQPRIDRKYKNIMSFLQTHAKLSRTYTPENIHQANGLYQKLIVGSDIVWGLDITKEDYTYFLDFEEDSERKYAFSSSVGNHGQTQWDAAMGEKLASFRQIAVREQDAVQWVYRLTGKQAQWVCDPTMLLTTQQWDQLMPPRKIKSGYVLVYFQDDKGKCMTDAQRYAKQHGLKVYYIHNSVKKIKGVHTCRPDSLQAFLDLIRNAAFIFTASYHGMLFATYYQKEFVFYTRAHSTRVLSLAERLGLQANCGDALQISNYVPVDYEQVSKKLQQFREESTAVLAEMLKQ